MTTLRFETQAQYKRLFAKKQFTQTYLMQTAPPKSSFYLPIPRHNRYSITAVFSKVHKKVQLTRHGPACDIFTILIRSLLYICTLCSYLYQSLSKGNLK